ncbi:MAG: TIGR04283 family arsenosugar biosynthesis glycosyltransferase [Pseudomonadota bacterium]
MEPCKTITVIVPMLNEASGIQQTLTHVLKDPQVTECVTVDGGSSDDTVAMVEDLGDSRIKTFSAPASRATQMNAGAKMATGDVLLFLHADTVLPTGFGRRVLTGLSPRKRWGCFAHSFSPNNWRLRLISMMHNLRCRISGVVYGDQAMFVGRRTFEDLGCFPTQKMEDVAFSVVALEALGKPVLIRQKLKTDSRKFVQIGEFKALKQVVSILLKYRRGNAVGNDAFFRNYR